MTLTNGPQPWDGTLVDARAFKNVLIWCTDEPGTPYGLHGSPDGTSFFNQRFTENASSGISVVNTFANIALYTCPGSQFVKLESGAGGTFFIAGVN